MKDEELKEQINALIRGEIQEVINDYVEDKESQVFSMEDTGLGFVEKEEKDELTVNISNREVERLIKEYKKIKKGQKSNLGQIRKMDKKGP
tara:strand:+ start:3231 stop:3503 length:273 start_codon:yes stop_codon:yes gene_type:complete